MPGGAGMKVIGTFSESPKEQARQTRELEGNARAANANLQRRIEALEQRIVALETAVAELS